MAHWSKQGAPLLSSKYLNNINDSTVGGALTSGPSGIGTQGGALQLADYLICNDAEALALSNTATGTLYEGKYQYVQLDSSATTTAKGQILFWKGGSTSVVTNVESGNLPDFAGIMLSTSASAGNYTFIQTQGKATVLFRATLTTTGALGQSVFMAAAGAGADNATADVLAATATYNPAYHSRYIGVAIATPANSTASLVRLRGGPFGY